MKASSLSRHLKGLVYISSLLWICGLFLINAHAQDATQFSLPEGAKARLGKGFIHDIAYSPNGTLIAVATSIGVWLYDAQDWCGSYTIAYVDMQMPSFQSLFHRIQQPLLVVVVWERITQFGLWDISNKKNRQQYTFMNIHLMMCVLLAFSPDWYYACKWR